MVNLKNKRSNPKKNWIICKRKMLVSSPLFPGSEEMEGGGLEICYPLSDLFPSSIKHFERLSTSVIPEQFSQFRQTMLYRNEASCIKISRIVHSVRASNVERRREYLDELSNTAFRQSTKRSFSSVRTCETALV